MKLSEAIAKFSLSPMAALEAAQARFDSWVNDVTGFGTGRDKTTYGTIAPSRRLSDIELSSLYHADDMAARMVDIVPQEMLREGFTVTTADKDLDVALKSKLDELGVREKLTDTIRWARLYGGAALLLGADDGRDSTLPLIPEYADSLAYMYVIDRRLLWPIEYYMEPGHPKFGQPKVYSVMSIGGPASYTANVHESRLVIFRGAPTGIYERAQWGSWDLSVLQRPFEILRQFNTGWKAVEVMMTDGNQAIFKMSGLRELIASGSMDLLRKRLEINELYRSVVRALVVDAESNESFERQGVSFTDIPATLDKFMLRLSAAVQIPVTILMGQSPAGMSATGDSDFRWFYDRIGSLQTTELDPRARRIVDVTLRTREFRERFKRPAHYEISYPSLWKLNPLEEAQRRLTIAQTDAANVTSQVLTPEEVALSRFTQRGFGEEIVLGDEARAARERVLSEDLDGMKGGQSADEQRTDGKDFNEEDHPRAKDGKFGSGGASTPENAKPKDGDGSKGGASRVAVVERKSAALHEEAVRQAKNAKPATGDGPLGGKREWTDTQFAGHSPSTIEDHFVDGKPTRARAEFHDREIIGPAFAGKKTAKELGFKRPIAILTMGGPASGKGTILAAMHKAGVDTSSFVHVDPDEVKGKLPEYEAQVPRDGGRTFKGAANQVHEESSYVAKQIRDRAIENGHHVVIDGTGGDADKFISLMESLKARGYRVTVHHADLDADEGVKRAAARAEGSGRFVPDSVVRETYSKIAKARDRIAEAAPQYFRYDAKENHRLVEKRRGGGTLQSEGKKKG